jgi:hypothetical protein
MDVLHTNGLVPLMNNALTLNTNRKIIMLFSGTRPTPEQFETARYSTANNTGIMETGVRGALRLNLLTLWATNLGSTLRAHCAYSNVLCQHLMDGRIRFPFVSAPEEFVITGTGPVTWFMLCSVNGTSLPTPTSALRVDWYAMGTIGDLESDADLILRATTIEDVTILKANDIVIDMQGLIP